MHITPKLGLDKLKDTQQVFVELYQHGSLTVEIYKPALRDLQEPHIRDEVYVVISGHGEFVNGSERINFNPGDFLFVAAGVPHRFENFSEDFATWVMFYGPIGGEAGKPADLHV
jgi:mannose-6-phosphate isomerase-like protein (cupin superfamily)